MSDIDGARERDKREYDLEDVDPASFNNYGWAVQDRHDCLPEIDRLKAEVEEAQRTQCVGELCPEELRCDEDDVTISTLKAERDAMETLLTDIANGDEGDPQYAASYCLAQIKGET